MLAEHAIASTSNIRRCFVDANLRRKNNEIERYFAEGSTSKGLIFACR